MKAPPVILHFCLGFSRINHPAMGYPLFNGNIMFISFSTINHPFEGTPMYGNNHMEVSINGGTQKWMDYKDL